MVLMLGLKIRKIPSFYIHMKDSFLKNGLYTKFWIGVKRFDPNKIKLLEQLFSKN